MEDWSDTPIYAQMMADKANRELVEAERIENPIYAQVLEETYKKEKLMESWQRSVVRMREAFDLPNSETPRTLTPAEAELHIKMIRDEFEKELVPALMNQDLVEIYDSGIDVIVYVIGMLTNAGFDIDPGFKEIMRNNMTKVDPKTGKVRRAVANDPSGEPEGKVLKPEGFVPVNLHPIINEQFNFGAEDKSVYRIHNVPITLGEGGPIIGQGDLEMDHNGVVTMHGGLDDVDILPQIGSFSIQDTEGQVVGVEELVETIPEPRTEPIVPEGWPVPINIDDIDPKETRSDASQEAYSGILKKQGFVEFDMSERRIVEDEDIKDYVFINVDSERQDEEVEKRRTNFISAENRLLRAAAAYMAQGEEPEEKL